MSLYSYEGVIWPDCFVGHSCPGGMCPESGPLSLTCSNITMLGTLLTIDTCFFTFFHYFSVEVCLVGVFPHFVSIWSDPCVRACVPLMNWRPPSRENNIVQGVTRFSIWAKRGGIWTDARVCLLYWVVIWVVGYWDPVLYCTVFEVCQGQETYGLKVVFCFRHFTASHYHHYARVLTGVENL